MWDLEKRWNYFQVLKKEKEKKFTILQSYQ